MKFYTTAYSYGVCDNVLSAAILDTMADYKFMTWYIVGKVEARPSDILEIRKYPKVLLCGGLNVEELDDSDIKFVEQVPDICYALALYSNGFYKKYRDRIKIGACKVPKYAYYIACQQDEGPDDITRKAACRDSRYALKYAFNVDMKYHKDTLDAIKHNQDMLCKYMDNFIYESYKELREAALQYPKTAYYYALLLIHGDDELRAIASKDPEYALSFAKRVDHKPHPVTKAGAEIDPYYAGRYKREIEEPYNRRNDDDDA